MIIILYSAVIVSAETYYSACSGQLAPQHAVKKDGESICRKNKSIKPIQIQKNFSGSNTYLVYHGWFELVLESLVKISELKIWDNFG